MQKTTVQWTKIAFSLAVVLPLLGACSNSKPLIVSSGEPGVLQTITSSTTTPENHNPVESGEPAGTTTVPATTPAPQVREITMTAKNWEFAPSEIVVNKGDTVKLHVTSIDVTHGFALPDFGVNENLEPGKKVDVEFTADKTGTFNFFCSVFCGEGHKNMKGTLMVK